MELRITISKGSTKMGTIDNISLDPRMTCRDMPCYEKGCNVCRLMKTRPSMRVAWMRNTKVQKRDREFYFKTIWAHLQKTSPKMFRWHVGGDIPDQGYLNYMLFTAHRFPKIQFLAFTKRYDLEFDWVKHDGQLEIVFSAWPGHYVPPRAFAWGFRFAWLEDDSRRPHEAIMCHGGCENCGMCWNLRKLGKDVYFPKK